MILAEPPQNVVIQGRPGSGKSMALLIAAISKIEIQKREPQVIIITPTHELAVQMAKNLSFFPQVLFEMAIRDVHGNI